MYVIQATIETFDRDSAYHSVRQVPTFILNEHLQGIVSEAHAAKIAKEVIDPFGRYTVNVTAVKL